MAGLLLSNHIKFFRGGREIGEVVDAYEWKFAIEIEEQMRFWKSIHGNDIDRIISIVKRQVDEITLNYSLTSEFSEELS